MVKQNPDFPQPFPTTVPFLSSNSVTVATVLVNSYALRDTSTHDYTTDGGTSASPGPFFLGVLGQSNKANRSIIAYKIIGVNTTDQTVTIQPIETPVPDYPPSAPLLPYEIGPSTSFTVASGTTNAGNYPWTIYPLEFLGVQVSAGTAPTTGTVSVILLIYYG